MAWETIREDPYPRVTPHLVDDEQVRRDFTWRQARAALAGPPDGRGLNTAHETAERHAGGSFGGRTALRRVARDGATASVPYAEPAPALAVSPVPQALGTESVGRVLTLLGRCPELYVARLLLRLRPGSCGPAAAAPRRASPGSPSRTAPSSSSSHTA